MSVSGAAELPRARPAEHHRRGSRRRVAFIAALLLPCVAAIALGADESRQVALNAIAIGGLSRTDFGIGMLEARTAVSPHLVVTAAPTSRSRGLGSVPPHSGVQRQCFVT